MAAGIYNFVLEQGATLSKPIVWRDAAGDPVDNTGFQARAQFRTNVQAPETVLDLTSENGGIELGGADGKITLIADAAATAAIAAKYLVYDLELVSGDGTVTRLLQGKVTVSPEVTR